MTRADQYHDTRLSHRLEGFTLVEVMVSITIASILSLALISAYSTQAGTYMRQGHNSQATDDGREIYMVLNHLLRQSINSSIAIAQTASTTRIDLQIPQGFPIWPNTTPPYNLNAIRISWSNTGTNANQIMISSATGIGALGAAPMVALAGSNAGSNTRVTGLTMAPAVPAGYLLSVTTLSGGAAIGSRGTVFDGMILPRN